MHPGALAEAGAHSLSPRESQTFVSKCSTSRGSGHGTGAPSLLANVSELGLPLAASFLPQPLLPAWHPNVGLLLEAEINPHVCLERLTDLAVVPREKPHTGAAAREQPRDSPVIER